MMEKSIKQSVVMSLEPSALVSAVLALRPQITGSVSTDILSRIQNLKGVLDSKTLTSARNGGDWRRGSGPTVNSSYWRPAKQGLQGSQQNGRPMNPVTSTSVSNASSVASSPQTRGTGVYTGPPTGRYQSRFKNHSEPLEEKILNRIIRLKLNKFSPTTYIEIRDFLFQILGQESMSIPIEEGGAVIASEGKVVEFVRDFMTIVFRKAASEETYCPLYAKLLAEIGSKHSVIFDEMASLYKNYMEIFEEPDVNMAAIDNAAFEKKNIEKKYRQGYSQFIAELTALEILSLDSLCFTFKKLISLTDSHSKMANQKPLVEEYVDCVLRMSRVLKSRQTQFFTKAKTLLWSENKDAFTALIHIRDETYTSLSPKSRFLLMDIQDILSS